MEDPSSPQFILLILFLCFSAFFTASETALTSLSKQRLLSMLDEGIKSAKNIEKLLKNKDKLQNAILIGDKLVDISAATIAASIAIGLADSNAALGLTTIIITVAILIFGEITPKAFAVKKAEKIACLTVKPMMLFVTVITPISVILNLINRFFLGLLGMKASDLLPIITETELKSMVDVGHEVGFIEVEERKMINNVFEFGDYHASDIMVPRTDMTAIPIDTSYNDMMRVFKEENYSRIPVFKENIDHIIGIIYLKDIVFLNENDKKSFTIDKFMRIPFFSYELKPTSQLLSDMRAERATMAVILDEYGGTSGIVTMQDLIEEIVGDITDEYDDEESDIKQIHDFEYTVDGSVRIDDFNDMVGTQFESDDYDSIGGFVIGLLNKIPVVGETIAFEGVHFTIESINKNRIDKLRIQILEFANNNEC